MNQEHTMDKNSLYLLGMYEKSMPNELTWEEKLLFCKEVGFDWLEISIDETDAKLNRLDWSKEERDHLCALIKKTQVPIYTMCLSGHRKYPLGSLDEEIHRRSLDIMSKAIDLAADLGVRIIQIAGYDVYYTEGNAETKKQFVNSLKEASIMAARKGVLLGFETMEIPFMDTVGKAMEYVSAVNSPYLKIYPDIGNLTNAAKLYNHEVVDDIKKGSANIIAAHLKETVPGKYREIPFGTGHTNFVKDIVCLKELGVRMFTGEFWYVGQDDWKTTCQEASTFLRSKLDEAFSK